VLRWYAKGMLDPGAGAILTFYAFFIGICAALFVGAALLPTGAKLKPISRAKRRQRSRRAS